MKIIVIGHGMVGHKFLESLANSGAANLQVTVLCEEPRPAYDRVHLSEFFSGKSADDLTLVKPGFFERDDMVLRLNTRATAIDLKAKTVTIASGDVLEYDKLVIATGSFPFVPPLPGKERKDCFVYRTIEDSGSDARMRQPLEDRRGDRRRPARSGMRQGAARHEAGYPRGRVLAAPDGGAGR
jgi:nitrite reductase (NADH) large subunit